MMEKTRPKCPQCGSRKIARILWGRQNISDELQKEIENGEAILGGCMVPKNSMNWHCRDCGLEFVKTGFDELVRFNKKQKPDYIKAHIHSFGNQKEIRGSQKCGCFHCLKTFDSAEVVEWIEDSSSFTALCPYCCIDSVIGDKSGFPITEEFLKTMRDYWFDFK